MVVKLTLIDLSEDCMCYMHTSTTPRFTKLLDKCQTLTHAEHLEERVPVWG